MIGQAHGHQFLVPLQQVGDGPLGDRDAAALKLPMNLGHTAMLGIAQGADEGNDVEAELAMRQGEAPLGLRAIGLAEQRTAGVLAATHRQRQLHRPV